MSISHVSDDERGAAKACAEGIRRLLKAAVDKNGAASLAVSGGMTPRLMFGFLSRLKVDWRDVHLFWVDERCVAADDPASNYGMTLENLIGPAHIPSENVHRVHGELPPEEAAQKYREEIKTHFRLKDGELPKFDILHLGMGDDGHVASLFPGSPLLEDKTGICAEVYVPKLDAWRVTLLPGSILASRKLVMLVSGATKAETLRQEALGAYVPAKYPVQIISRQFRNANWYLDKAAAEGLT